MSHPQPVARQVVVHGRVQGVFFRDTCRRLAVESGVSGWVLNELDGTVRAHFEGPPDAVERMVRWSHEGPRHAAVDRVDVSEEPPRLLTGFQVC